MAGINPMQPNQGNILKKSPILTRERKRIMQPVVGENLKNIQKSITPNVRSKPYGEK
jgi:hypothetical protein